MMPTWLRSLPVLLLAASIRLAHADSIVFIKEHDVWIANADGSAARAITVDGTEDRPYRSPSQADDGRIWAGFGMDVVQLNQQGLQLALFMPTRPEGSVSFGNSPPLDVAVSADGSKLAYTFYGNSCMAGTPCGSRQMTGYVSADGTESYGHEFNLTNPEWVSSDTVLGFGGLFRQVRFDALHTGTDDGVTWFNDAANADLRDGELSRRGDRLAVLRDDGTGRQLRIFAVANGTEVPVPACGTETIPTVKDTSWSPDGTKLAVAHAEGIEVLSLPVVVDGECPGAQALGVVIAGGSEPDWGPADVQPRYEINAELAPRTKLRKALRKGLVLTVSTDTAGMLSGRLVVDGNEVASGSASLGAGQGTITFRFTKAARKQLARRKVVAIHADLTFQPESGVTVPVSGSVELRR